MKSIVFLMVMITLCVQSIFAIRKDFGSSNDSSSRVIPKKKEVKDQTAKYDKCKQKLCAKLTERNNYNLYGVRECVRKLVNDFGMSLMSEFSFQQRYILRKNNLNDHIMLYNLFGRNFDKCINMFWMKANLLEIAIMIDMSQFFSTISSKYLNELSNLKKWRILLLARYYSLKIHAYLLEIGFENTLKGPNQLTVDQTVEKYATEGL